MSGGPPICRDSGPLQPGGISCWLPGARKRPACWKLARRLPSTCNDVPHERVFAVDGAERARRHCTYPPGLPPACRSREPASPGGSAADAVRRAGGDAVLMLRGPQTPGDSSSAPSGCTLSVIWPPLRGRYMGSSSATRCSALDAGRTEGGALRTAALRAGWGAGRRGAGRARMPRRWMTCRTCASVSAASKRSWIGCAPRCAILLCSDSHDPAAMMPLHATLAASSDTASGVGIPLALAAGLVSFLSPCVLPLVPGYLSTVIGVTPADLKDTGARGCWCRVLLFIGSSRRSSSCWG